MCWRYSKTMHGTQTPLTVNFCVVVIWTWWYHANVLVYGNPSCLNTLSTGCCWNQTTWCVLFRFGNLEPIFSILQQESVSFVLFIVISQQLLPSSKWKWINVVCRHNCTNAQITFFSKQTFFVSRFGLRICYEVDFDDNKRQCRLRLYPSNSIPGIKRQEDLFAWKA